MLRVLAPRRSWPFPAFAAAAVERPVARALTTSASQSGAPCARAIQHKQKANSRVSYRHRHPSSSYSTLAAGVRRSRTAQSSQTASAATRTQLRAAFASAAVTAPSSSEATHGIMTQTPAVGSGPGAEKHGNFKLVRRVTLDYAPGMSVEKWVSDVTGLTVVWANFESPLINSYVAVATEIFNDSGVPHTLEHLIFLGSEQYPYKGVLDSLANRAFAQGTNAWTSGTETCYTLTTAGSDGFLRMLPVYLDHVFFPRLTDSGFVTEVYHINGKGEDAGVVFSEMQGRENGSGDLIELKTQRMLYPPTSAYRSETGGLMSALRVLSIDEIRRYHRTYYAPHNAAVVVCGKLDRASLLDAVQSTEEKLVSKQLAFGTQGPPGWKRPFLETASAVPPKIEPDAAAANGTASAEEPQRKRRRRAAVVEFPEQDESMGEVEITWLGPTIDEWLQNEALSVLGTYLTDSAVSPIQQAFVERDDPYCTDVYFGSADKAGATTLYAYFSSVPAERLESLDEELVGVLEKVAADGIDMDRMKTIIKRDRLKLLSSLETKPADSFADVLIADFLYGKRDGTDLDKALDDMRRFDELGKWASSQWVELLQKYFIDGARLVVVGRPSAPLAEKLRTDTKALVEQRQKELGEAGLKKLEEKLEEAKQENDKDIPPEMLSRFKIPSVDSIEWIPVGTARNIPTKGTSVPPLHTSGASELDQKVQAHVDADGASLPFFVQYDHVNSAFLTVSLIFSTADLPAELRQHITLYLSTLFVLPVTRQDGSGAKLPYEEVIRLLDEDTLEYDASLGISSGFGENICVDLKVPKENFEKAVAWLRDIVWGSEFAVERLRVAAAKLQQSLPEQKRDGRSISVALLRQLTRDAARSSSAANTVIEQAQSLPAVVQQLADEPQKVVDMFEHIRASIMRPENMRVSVAGDILALTTPRGTFRNHFVQGWQPQDTLPVQWTRDVLSPLGKQPAKKGLICSLPTIESSYAYFTARGIEDYQHPDYAAVVVATAVLNAMESYLWRYIRGAGLAYGSHIGSDAESQLISFSLYRSPDSGKAFLEARKVLQALASGEMELDETTVESAKSSLHFSVADSEGTVMAAAGESFMDSVMRGTGKNRGRRLLEETSKVSLPEVRNALKKYILPIFDPATSVCAIASTPSRTKEIADALSAVGYEMETRDLDLGEDASGSEAGSSEAGSNEGSVHSEWTQSTQSLGAVSYDQRRLN